MDRESFVEALNEDLELEFQSIVQYVQHIAIIKEFFDAGHGVYIWGDNDPYYVDANRLASALVPGLRMEGNLYGNNTVNIADGKNAKVGLRAGHLITTGLEHLYEGITIATIQFGKADGRNDALYDGKDGSVNALSLSGHSKIFLFTS